MAVPDRDRDRALRAVRSTLHRLGYRFRLRRDDLPGRPDIVLPRWRLTLFVVDCARFPHPGCPRAAVAAELGQGGAGRAALTRACDALGRLGWETLIIQACETEDPVALGYRLDITLQGNLIALPSGGSRGARSASPPQGARGGRGRAGMTS